MEIGMARHKQSTSQGITINVGVAVVHLQFAVTKPIRPTLRIHVGSTTTEWPAHFEWFTHSAAGN